MLCERKLNNELREKDLSWERKMNDQIRENDYLWEKRFNEERNNQINSNKNALFSLEALSQDQNKNNSLLQQEIEQKEKYIVEIKAYNEQLQKKYQNQEEKQRREHEESIRSWEKKHQEKIDYYERRISEYNNQISSMQATYHSSLSSFSHRDCEDRYNQMEERYKREIETLRDNQGSEQYGTRSKNEEI